MGGGEEPQHTVLQEEYGFYYTWMFETRMSSNPDFKINNYEIFQIIYLSGPLCFHIYKIIKVIHRVFF